MLLSRVTFLKYTPVVIGAINSTNNFHARSSAQPPRSTTTHFASTTTIGTKDLLSFYYIWNNTYNAGAQVFGHDADNNLAKTRNYNVTETHVFNSVGRQLLPVRLSHLREVETFGTTDDPGLQHRYPDGYPLRSERASLLRPPDHYYQRSRRRLIVRTISSDRSVLAIVPTATGTGATTSAGSSRRHLLEFGGDLLYRNVTFDQIRNPRGQFTFNGQYTGSALVDFLLGYIQNDSSNPTHTSTNLYDIYPSLYLQDNYKMTRNLTLNLGVRWDYFQPYTQADDLYADIYQSGNVATTVATPQSGSLYGRGLIQSNWKDVGPRIGFAWSPYPTTVVRARLRHLLHN